MYQPLPPILPGFPDTEPFKELRFHLKELHWDLTGLLKKVETLSTVMPDTPQAFGSLRYELMDITSGIQHDISHHLGLTLKLAGQILERPSLLEVGERLVSLEASWDSETPPPSEDRQTNEPSRLQISLKALASDLRLALEATNQVAWSQGEQPRGLGQLDIGLEHLVEVLGSQVWSQSQQLYTQAFQLHRAADPMEAVEEDYWQHLATPRRQEYHSLARSLDFCPHCGAELSSDDRTFNGSYCESCRTAWIQSPQSSEE